MARDTVHETKNYQPRALVYFLDKNWTNAQNLLAAKVIVPDVEDIMSITTSRGTTGVVGNFSITVNNENNKYFIADDIQKDINNLNTPPTYDDIPDSRGGVALEELIREREKYPWLTVSDFLDQKIIRRRYSPPGTTNEYILTYNEDEQAWGYWDIPEGVKGTKYSSNTETLEAKDIVNRFVKLSDTERKDLEDVSARHSDFFTKYGGDLTRGRCLFEPMQRCIILLSHRIHDKNSDYDMVTAFTGLVSTVTDTYQENQYLLSIKGEDLTKWLRITLLNINPALLTEALPESGDFLIYENRFANMEGWEIIKTLVLGNYYDKTPEEIAAAKLRGDLLLNGVGQYEYRTMTDPTMSITATNIKFQKATADGINVEREEFPEDGKNTIEKLLFNKDTLHLQTFQGVTLRRDETGNFIASPYKVFFRQSLNSFVNEYSTNWDVAVKVAEATNFEFYADPTGDLWYHQPRFNNYHILTHESPETYIIRDEDIISADFSESDDEVVTSIIATGMQDVINVDGVQPVFDMINFYEDIGLVRKYGRRLFVANHPYVRSKEDCFFYAKSLLYRINAERFSGALTITGRAEIQPAMPVYIAYRNMIYYIKQVEHKFEFGGRFTTTLQLTWGHKPWEVLQEVLDYKTIPPMTAAERLKLFGKIIEYLPAYLQNGEKPQIIGQEGNQYIIRATGTVKSTIPGTLSITQDAIIITGTGEYKGITVYYEGGVHPIAALQKKKEIQAGQPLGEIYGIIDDTTVEATTQTNAFSYRVELRGSPIELNVIHDPPFDVNIPKKP